MHFEIWHESTRPHYWKNFSTFIRVRFKPVSLQASSELESLVTARKAQQPGGIYSSELSGGFRRIFRAVGGGDTP